MIAEIFPEAYDAVGRQVSQPFLRAKGPHPNYPFGRYVGQPLTIECADMVEVRQFLCSCNYVSDQKLFGKKDYWQPPDEFELRKKGDCEDFALWTWRQLLFLGYDARFICGKHGRYGVGHAWVEYCESGRWFLLEPLFSKISQSMPRLATLRYDPALSVSWDGKTLRYFAHKRPHAQLSWRTLAPAVWEYSRFWSWFWATHPQRIPLIPWLILRRLVMSA